MAALILTGKREENHPFAGKPPPDTEMQPSTFMGLCMRTTLDLPDDVLGRAKIDAVERGSTLRQLVVDALQREMAATGRPRRQLERAPIKLAADAPLRTLSPAAVKRLDTASVTKADEAKSRALHR